MIRLIRLRSVLWFGLVAGCGSAPKRLYYESTRIQHRAIEGVPRLGLEGAVRGFVAEKSVRVRQGRGTYRRIKPTSVKRLKTATLWAIHTMAQQRFLGAEVDLVVWLNAQKRELVSVKVALDGSMKVDVGTGPYARQAPPEPSLQFEDGQRSWTVQEKRSVNDAFSLLSPAEQRLVHTLPFRRMNRAEDPSKSALYVQKNCSAHIEVFDSAFQADRWQFVGSAQAPRRASIRIVLHEIGHAIEKHDSVRAYCRYERAYKALNKRIKAFNTSQKRAGRSEQKKRRSAQEYRAIEVEKERLERQVEDIEAVNERGPMLAQYLSILAGKSPPTRYGERSTHESFAESFSLFRSDPDALGRLLPRVLAWFQRGEHLNALDKPAKRQRPADQRRPSSMSKPR
ncbi:MAG: hypothetical protein VX589_17295 [Myxococcota bacterium]|nr:hypothetical protein [Myxococcota bacterium]